MSTYKRWRARWRHRRALWIRRKIRLQLATVLASYASYGWNMQRDDEAKMRREMLRSLLNGSTWS